MGRDQHWNPESPSPGAPCNSISALSCRKWYPRWQHKIVTYPPFNTGWWYTYPSEKYESIGIIIPNIWKKTMFQTTNQTRCAHSFAPLDMVQMCRDWKFCWVYTPYLFVVELDRAARCPLSWSPPIAGHHGHQRHFGRGSVDRQPVQTRFLARDINPQKNITGWWCNHHLEKSWSSSMGRILHPIYEMENQSHVWNHQQKPTRVYLKMGSTNQPGWLSSCLFNFRHFFCST